MWNLYMNRVLIQSSARAHASVSQLRPNATYSFQVRPPVCLSAVIPVATLRQRFEKPHGATLLRPCRLRFCMCPDGLRAGHARICVFEHWPADQAARPHHAAVASLCHLCQMLRQRDSGSIALAVTSTRPNMPASLSAVYAQVFRDVRLPLGLASPKLRCLWTAAIVIQGALDWRGRNRVSLRLDCAWRLRHCAWAVTGGWHLVPPR